MAVHAAAGMVAMAALMLPMMATGAPAGIHHHGGAPSFVGPAAALGAAYVVPSVVLAARATAALDGGQYVAMAASVGLMSLSLVA